MKKQTIYYLKVQEEYTPSRTPILMELWESFSYTK